VVGSVLRTQGPGLDSPKPQKKKWENLNHPNEGKKVE
jgi:hypothetical protein